jgi:hypothetical protein
MLVPRGIRLIGRQMIEAITAFDATVGALADT